MELEIIGARLRNQRLSGTRFDAPEDVVRWMGAVQAQEYDDSKWALALRLRRPSDASIEGAFTEGRILRTHVLRPTWHFVAPADIRWMLALTGPRVAAAMASYNRKLELNAGIFRRAQGAFAKALRGGVQLTRQELKSVLERAGIPVGGVQRLAHIAMQAELDAVICSGARRGKQFTYALLDERVPAARARTRDAALAELTRRYFTSHGPAQVHDFAWWSGLTVADARAGLEMVSAELARDTVGGRTYWFSAETLPTTRSRLSAPVAHLLPLYDEYLIAYKDRSAALDVTRWTQLAGREPFGAPVVLDGRVVGGWRRRVQKEAIVIAVSSFRPLDRATRRAVAEAAGQYARFFGSKSKLSLSAPR